MPPTLPEKISTFNANNAQQKPHFRRNRFIFSRLQKQIISDVYTCMLTNVISHTTVLGYGA